MRQFGIAILGLVLVGCASAMSKNAELLRSQMNEEQALAVLKKYSKPTAERGGLCWDDINFFKGAKLDEREPPQFSGSNLKFTAFYARPTGVSSGTQNGRYQVVKNFKIERGQFSLDLKTIEAVRVLGINPSPAYLLVCPGAKPGQNVMLFTKQLTEANGGLSLNPRTEAELDEVLAAISRLSPNAKMRKGML